MPDRHMTIREMCDAYEVTPRALRFYESKELLAPVRQGTRRLFTRRDRARLTLILRGKRFGFSLEDIRQLLDLYDGDENHKQISKARALGQEKLSELYRQRDEIDQIIVELTNELKACEDIKGVLKTTKAA